MVGTENRKVAFTVDLEEYSVPEEFGLEPLPGKSSIEISKGGVIRLLEILEKARIKATFFATGFFTQKSPELLREVVELGHEVASHGIKHFLPVSQTCAEKLTNLRKTNEIIEKTTGKTPVGFREPFLRIREDTIRALEKLSFVYDSSLLPVHLPPKYNRIRGKPTLFTWDVEGQRKKSKPLLEIPISVTPLLRIPVGWWWFRKNFGQRLCLFGFNSIWRRGQPVVLHVHPWELAQLPYIPSIPFHVWFNCGEKSVAQVVNLLREVSGLNATFVTMSNIADWYHETHASSGSS